MATLFLRQSPKLFTLKQSDPLYEHWSVKTNWLDYVKLSQFLQHSAKHHLQAEQLFQGGLNSGCIEHVLHQRVDHDVQRNDTLEGFT